MGFDHRNSTGLAEPETPLLKGVDKVLCPSGPRGKKAVTSEEIGSDLPAHIRGSPVEAGGGCGSLQGQGHWQWYFLGIFVGISPEQMASQTNSIKHFEKS